jgi:hypothetical protein
LLATNRYLLEKSGGHEIATDNSVLVPPVHIASSASIVNSVVGPYVSCYPSPVACGKRDPGKGRFGHRGYRGSLQGAPRIGRRGDFHPGRMLLRHQVRRTSRCLFFGRRPARNTGSGEVVAHPLSPPLPSSVGRWQAL